MNEETLPTPPRATPPTRSGSDAVIGGVATGLARYFNVDALLFRIGFVALSFVGGIGVLAYLLLLAFMPVRRRPRARAARARRPPVAGAVVLGVALVAFLGTPFFFFGPGLLVVAVVGLAGFPALARLSAEDESPTTRPAPPDGSSSPPSSPSPSRVRPWASASRLPWGAAW